MTIENAAPAEQPSVAEIGQTTDTYNNPLGSQVADKELSPQPETQEKPDHKPEDKQPAKSPREAVERALAKAKEAPATEDKGKEQPKTGEKPVEQPKVEANQQKPAVQPATQEKAPTVEGDQQQGNDPSKQARNDAPSRFHDVAKQEWNNTPESVRAEVHRSLSELENGLNKYRQSHDKYEAIREFDELATTHGTTVKDALANYTGIERLLHQDPFAALEQIVANVATHKRWTNPDGSQVSFRDLAAHYLNQPADRVASRQDSVIRQMSEQIAQLTNRSVAFEQSMQENRLRETQTLIQEFAKDHPRTEELAEDIAFLIESKRVATLQEAYELADRMNPSKAPLTQVPETTKENPAAQTRSEAKPVNPAGVKSISGAPTAGSDPRSAGKPSNSPREALQKALRKVK
ncbi:hypothetical protein J3U99_20705 [Brucella pituitosa]|uniref:hypothetical protein n=1 Tax=Brucella pituitosa TaxID=571256 RepID=UPI00200341B9|nr:hypothetical protein [Brucella pituitosa]MCK4207192.1 hypothetical protein [Brucella pituitosa]